VIVASLLLILVAVVLLVLGLAGGSSLMLITSIAASLLAAVALVVGARQAAATRATDRGRGPTGATPPAGPRTAYGPPMAEPEIPVQHVRSTVGTGDTGWRQPPGSPVTGPDTLTDPVEAAPFTAHPGEAGPFTGPTGAAADEPPAQAVTPAEAALVARLGAEVFVVDGRPRYHLADCPQLTGREHALLPVSEAVELGFTPCGRCAPDTALLADARPI
jgi:hypothetical protein